VDEQKICGLLKKRQKVWGAAQAEAKFCLAGKLVIQTFPMPIPQIAPLVSCDDDWRKVYPWRLVYRRTTLKTLLRPF
jgi:hypothetical protein